MPVDVQQLKNRYTQAALNVTSKPELPSIPHVNVQGLGAPKIAQETLHAHAMISPEGGSFVGKPTLAETAAIKARQEEEAELKRQIAAQEQKNASPVTPEIHRSVAELVKAKEEKPEEVVVVKKKEGEPKVEIKSSGDKCKVCDKTVYLTEGIVLEGGKLHKACFKCEKCKMTLTLRNYAAYDGHVMCKTHFAQSFKVSGGKYDGMIEKVTN